MRHKAMTIVGASLCWRSRSCVLMPVMRRDFFPGSGLGGFRNRRPRAGGTRIEETEKLVAKVENFIARRFRKKTWS